MGWAWVELISGFAEVTVVTRENNRAAIEAAAAQHEWVRQVRWVYHDLSEAALGFKRRSGLVQPYYAAWQRSARRAIRDAVADRHCDVVHHLTFGTYWMPYATDEVGAPVIIGPVGGAEAPPFGFVIDDLGGFVFEASRYVARWFMERLGLVRRPVRDATLCIAKAQETADRLVRMGARRVVVRSEVVMPDSMGPKVAASRSSGGDLRIVSVSRLVHLKGIQLALKALAQVRDQIPPFTYTLVGDGPYRRQLERLVDTLGLQDVVVFEGMLQRDVALRRLEGADIFVHPSLHDSGGWACIEAMWSGVPVVCLAIGGPANQVTAQTGRIIPLRGPRDTVAALGAAIVELGGDERLRRELGAAARLRVETEYAKARQSEWLRETYRQVVEAGGS